MKYLSQVSEIAAVAGARILEHYQQVQPAAEKPDKSPLTAADMASHACISGHLNSLTPGIPVLSEESKPESYTDRQNWSRFWCVDPLDGTKEFLKKTGQFTVNIALIEGSTPILGVIDVPAMQIRYYAAKGEGSWMEDYGKGQAPKRLQVRSLNGSEPQIVASKDHAGPLVQKLSERFPNAGFKSMGSSLKFCLVAAGEADVYLRDVPTYEWDTAAAQIIVEEAGGQVLTLDGQPLTYNKESLLNPSVITVGSDPDYWLSMIGND